MSSSINTIMFQMCSFELILSWMLFSATDINYIIATITFIIKLNCERFGLVKFAFILHSEGKKLDVITVYPLLLANYFKLFDLAKYFNHLSIYLFYLTV